MEFRATSESLSQNPTTIYRVGQPAPCDRRDGPLNTLAIMVPELVRRRRAGSRLLHRDYGVDKLDR